MATKTVRKIVHIDEEKCNGCGQCVPSCAEGALKIIDGKARLVADNLCDGLGACLGHCPMDAIRIEERPAEGFDEQAVHAHLHPPKPLPAIPVLQVPAPLAPAGGGCPGSRMRMLRPAPAKAEPAGHTSPRPSRLGQWPIQLALLPVVGPMWVDADVLLAADCVPFAYPAFHETMLAGKTLAIACPKLDEIEPYIHKLAVIVARNSIRSITIAHMEVPCCGGLLRIVHAALQQADRTDIPVHDITVAIDGALAARA